ncbi:MAG: S9 family peptidase [Deltaproteobacteria bacterium]|nr:S9 family peptidase [Deltaproteobacteria bacterium]
MDGIPEIPSRIADRTLQYQNARGASLYDFAPAGEGILIGTRFAETSQVHFVAREGGYRQQLTFLREPVKEARFDRRHGIRGFVFSMDTGGGEFYQHYWFDRDSGRHVLLTDGKSRNETLLPSRLGGKLAYASTRRNGTDFDIYVQELPGGTATSEARLVEQVQGQWNPIDWSRDDSKLLLRHYVSVNESTLHVLDLSTGIAREVNPSGGKKISHGAAVFSLDGGGVYYASDEDSEFQRLTFIDLKKGTKEVLTAQLPWDVVSVAVSEDGRWLAYAANEGGTTAVYLAPTKTPKKAKRVDLPRGVLVGDGARMLRFDSSGRKLGLALSTAQSTTDVFSVDVATRKLARWTFSEVGGLNLSTLVAPDLIEFPSPGGGKIPAWYYRPRQRDGKPFPVVISIHGGPEAQSMASFNPLVQYWVNELGAAVLVPNVRGSSGYGKSYLLLDNVLRREDSVKDIGALLDWIATRSELDARRVGVFGGSYGGYMVLASLIHFGERLRCGVEIVGISNFVTFLENTESYRRDLRRAEYGDERDPEVRSFLLSISPTTHASKIKQPLFVAQGLNDPRVPASEAEQIVKTVRQNGGSVWYLLARDEGHGFQKKTNRDYYINAVNLFFETYLVRPDSPARTAPGALR